MIDNISKNLDGPPLLFLDLDGTVRHGKDELGHFVNGPDDVAVFPEAVARIQAWRREGGRVFGVTNQAGVALGHMTEQACKEATHRTIVLTHGLIEGVFVCPHAPDAGCFCRKPQPGMLYAAASEAADLWGDTPRVSCLMVGDRPEDMAAANAAGVPFKWAADWRAGR